MGKKWKLYHLKTNSKGVANFNVKKLKPGTHDVFIYIEEVHSKYDLEKNSKYYDIVKLSCIANNASSYSDKNIIR